MINGTLRTMNFLDERLSFYRRNDTNYFHRKKGETITYRNKWRIRSRNRGGNFSNNQEKHSLFPLSPSWIDTFLVDFRGAQNTTSTHNNFFSFPLLPSPPSPNQITESPSPQQQQAGWIIVDSTSINLRDITSQYSSGFTLLDAPFSSLISSSARLI